MQKGGRKQKKKKMISTKFDYSVMGTLLKDMKTRLGTNHYGGLSMYLGDTVLMILSQSSAIRGVYILIFE